MPTLPNSHTTTIFSPKISTLAILPKLALPLAILTLLAVLARLYSETRLLVWRMTESEHGVQWIVGVSVDRVVGVLELSRGNEQAIVRVVV
jgi:hypothetical protein